MSVISKEPETSDSYDITITSGVKLQEQTEESDEESDEETTPSIDSLPEPAEETTEEDVQQQLALLEKLLNEYEQCKNIPDLLSQAKEELANGNIAKSQELLDFALTNCRDTLQAEQREQPSTILTPDSNASKIAISAGVIVLLSLFGYALYTRNSSLKK